MIHDWNQIIAKSVPTRADSFVFLGVVVDSDFLGVAKVWNGTGNDGFHPYIVENIVAMVFLFYYHMLTALIPNMSCSVKQATCRK